jgi:hypothetical protein
MICVRAEVPFAWATMVAARPQAIPPGRNVASASPGPAVPVLEEGGITAAPRTPLVVKVTWVPFTVAPVAP